MKPTIYLDGRIFKNETIYVPLTLKDEIVCLPVTDENGETVYTPIKDYKTNPKQGTFINQDFRKSSS